MVNAAPEPLVAPEVDLRDFPYMPLDVVRLRDCDLSASATGEEFRAAVLLWCASWHQIPAASLPDDDAVLSALAGYGRIVKEWLKVKRGALRHWVKCSDGRLYHPTVAEKANEAWEAKKKQRDRTAAARNARLSSKHKNATTEDATSPVTSSVTETVTSSKGEGREKEGRIDSDNLPASQLTARARASSAELDLRKAIVDVYAAYGAAIPPETGHAAVWLAQGYPPELCLSVVRSKMPGARDKGLKWFDKAIAEAASVKAPQPRRSEPPDDPSDPLVDLGGSKRRESEIRKHLAAWLDDKRKNTWNTIAFGFSPDDPGCRVPTGILAEFGLRRVPYPVDDEAAA
ncbi:DUF1376 domain-containing protein [Methylocystis rosea]|uniref:DUF1376 domain-containing protein n=1 Tax=Methylocystis rosea TaxID=173366 RepID=UPI000365F513|nr:DUF1376 domain-containing protein [Methylocystis rosea]